MHCFMPPALATTSAASFSDCWDAASDGRKWRKRDWIGDVGLRITPTLLIRIVDGFGAHGAVIYSSRSGQMQSIVLNRAAMRDNIMWIGFDTTRTPTQADTIAPTAGSGSAQPDPIPSSASRPADKLIIESDILPFDVVAFVPLPMESGVG